MYDSLATGQYLILDQVIMLYLIVKSSWINFLQRVWGLDEVKLILSFTLCFVQLFITDMSPQARIDSHNKILYARHADQRNATFQRVLQTGSEFDRDVRSMLLRANLIKYEFNLRASRKP